MASFEELKLKEYKYWTLYLHANQHYLGRAYAWLKRPGEMQRLSSLLLEERDELLDELLVEYEDALAELWAPDHMNYAWLGNFFHEHQGHGHMHLIPRYSHTVPFACLEFRDDRWGKNYAPCPDLVLPDNSLFAIRDALRQKIP